MVNTSFKALVAFLQVASNAMVSFLAGTENWRQLGI